MFFYFRSWTDVSYFTSKSIFTVGTLCKLQTHMFGEHRESFHFDEY